MHLAIEMLAALAVGGGMGWLFDDFLGTKPWLFVVFIFLGIGAGILNAFRAAQKLGATPFSQHERRREDEDEDGRSQG
jgi:ATP synthase protein I